MIYKYRYKIYQYPNYLVFDTNTIIEAEKWCKEQFGIPYRGRWALFSDAFTFANKEDYAYFLLRWS